MPFKLVTNGFSGVPNGGFDIPIGGVNGLSFVTNDLLGAPGGLAVGEIGGLINPGTIDNSSYPDIYVTITGPLKGRKNTPLVYQITNYGFKRDYQISSDYGTITRDRDIITFTPAYGGWVTFNISGRTFEIRTSTEEVQAPYAEMIGFSETAGGTMTVRTSPFRSFVGTDTHKSSSYEVFLNPDFDPMSKLFSIDADTVNKIGFSRTGVNAQEPLYLRLLYEATERGETDTGPVTKFTTPRVLTGTLPSGLGGTLQPVEAIVTLPTGGSMKLTTNTGWTTTLTTSGVVSIPAGNNVLTMEGKGGPSITVNTPGQPYIAPSGPVYVNQQTWVPEQSGYYWRVVVALRFSGATRTQTGYPIFDMSEYNARINKTSRPYSSDPSQSNWGTMEGWAWDSSVGGYRLAYCDFEPEFETIPGYYVNTSVFSHYTNPGQPYIAPSTRQDPGPVATLGISGSTYTFPGGTNGVASATVRQHNLVTEDVPTSGTISPTEVVCTIPSGGFVKVSADSWTQTLNTNGAVSAPAGIVSLTVEARGGTATSVSDPGRPYIAPSGPIYSSRDVWVPAVAEVSTTNWKLSSEQLNTRTEAGSVEAAQSTVNWYLAMSQSRPSNPSVGQSYVEYLALTTWSDQTKSYSAYNVTKYTWTYTKTVTQAAKPGYWTTETYQTGWTNPGQSYIAPSTVWTPAPNTVVTIGESTLTFAGGTNGEATTQTRQHILVADSAPGGGFGSDISIDDEGKFFISGTPLTISTSNSQPASVAIMEMVGGNPIIRQRFYSESPPTTLQLTIPAGGNIRVSIEDGGYTNYTSSRTISIPERTTRLVMKGRGAAGTTISDPGQPYVAPSNPVYTTQDVWVPGKEEVSVLEWVKTGQEHSEEFKFATEAERDSVYFADYHNLNHSLATTPSYEGEVDRQVVAARAAAPDTITYSWTEYAGVKRITSPATSGYWTTEQVFSHYANPGQSYIAPSTRQTTGESASASFMGRTVTFAGGTGGAATEMTHEMESSVNNSLGASVFMAGNGLIAFGGAPKDFNTQENAGSVRQFDPIANSTGWTRGARIISPTPVRNAEFGSALCSDATGNRLFVAALGENAVYYFQRVSGVMTFKQKINITNETVGSFGKTIACSPNGNHLIVGAPDTVNTSTNKGAAFLFSTTDGNSFTLVKRFSLSYGSNTFTYNVPVGGELKVDQLDAGGTVLSTRQLEGTGTITLVSNTILLRTRGAGVPSSTDHTTMVFDGITYTYPAEAEGKPTELFRDIPIIRSVTSFGADVDVSDTGERVWISAPGATSSHANQGMVTVYDKQSSLWNERQRFVSVSPAANGNFGQRIQCTNNGQRAVIGDPGAENGVGVMSILDDRGNGYFNMFSTFYTTITDLRNFGREVAVSGNGKVQLAANPLIENSRGCIYVFGS